MPSAADRDLEREADDEQDEAKDDHENLLSGSNDLN
jgi:hypothetical protein